MSRTDRSATKETRFHDYTHAVEYDRRAAQSDIRAQLAVWLVEALALSGNETILDLATGTGRFARPVGQRLGDGKIIGLDEAFAMLQVAREQREKEPIPRYLQVAGVAQSLPFCDRSFDSAFVSFAFHHFGRPAPGVVREVGRVLKPGGKFIVVDPVLCEPRDDLDGSLHDRINGIFRRSHGGDFRFHTAEEIKGHLQDGGLEISRADVHFFAIDQLGADGIPTGRHWLEVAEEMDTESEAMRERFEKNYLKLRKEAGSVRIQGRLSYAVICGERRE